MSGSPHDRKLASKLTHTHVDNAQEFRSSETVNSIHVEDIIIYSSTLQTKKYQGLNDVG